MSRETAWPPVGESVPIVYDPRDPVWADRRQGFGLELGSTIVLAPIMLLAAALMSGGFSYMFVVNISKHFASW
jgi:hypothetical protein